MPLDLDPDSITNQIEDAIIEVFASAQTIEKAELVEPLIEPPTEPQADPKPQRKLKWTHRRCKHIIVIGAGGVGFYLTLGLMADSLDQDVTVYDADNFVGGNGHRRLPQVINRDLKKVDMLKATCAVTYGYEAPITHARKFTVADAQSLNSTYLVVDASDMPFQERSAIWDAFIKAGAKGVRVSYDGNGIVCIAYGPPFSPPDDQGGYDRMPSTAQSLLAGGAGAEFVKAVLQGEKMDEMQIEIGTGIARRLMGQGDVVPQAVPTEVPDEVEEEVEEVEEVEEADETEIEEVYEDA